VTLCISFAGLRGTGKTTIARLLSRETGAVYLRIDEIDATIWRIDPRRDIGPESYYIAAALATSNLELGHTVIIDCVNPLALTREIFAAAAKKAGVELVGVETFCSDQLEHRRRIETRAVDIPGLKTVSWAAVLAREYSPWEEAVVRIDTTHIAPEETVRLIQAHLG
jgi:predicted kinase